MSIQSLKEGEGIAKKSILHLILLGLIKAFAGWITGMSVIIADAVSTFADILGVFASYFGLRLSRKSANEKFEYGYYKIETLAALLISLGIMYAGYKILMNGINTFRVAEEGQYRPFAITSTIISIVLSYRLAKKLKTAGEKANSLSLIANAKDKKIDIFAGIIILISIFANYRDIPYVEGVVTIVIALFVLKEGLFSSKESLFFLLDYWDDPSLTKQIRKIFAKEKDLVTEVKKLKLRRAGTFIFGEAFVEINPYTGLDELREELDLLKKQVEDLNPYIKDFSIYTHISKAAKVRVAVPMKKGNSLQGKVAATLRETNSYLFVDIKNGKVAKFRAKKLPPAKKTPVEFANFLKKEKVNIVIDNQLNSLIYYNLRKTHHILIYPNFSDANKVEQTIKLLLIDT